MISGINAYDGNFLADLTNIETRISQANKEISSGFRVNEASDDPSSVGAILDYQELIAQITQLQGNLGAAQTEANTADGALQSAATLLDQLASIASQGASSTASAATRATLGQQVQQIERELVNLANATVGGRYIFGGDDTATAPYTFDWTVPGGVVQNSNAANTATIRDADGNTLVPRMTAQQIFDTRNPDNTPAANNIFHVVYALGAALLANDQAGAQSAVDSLGGVVAQLGSATTFYGNAESWIGQANTSAGARLDTLQTALSHVREADIPAMATQLSLEKTALDAALSAHGNLNTRTLFSYLG